MVLVVCALVWISIECAGVHAKVFVQPLGTSTTQHYGRGTRRVLCRTMLSQSQFLPHLLSTRYILISTASARHLSLWPDSLVVALRFTNNRIPQKESLRILPTWKLDIRGDWPARLQWPKALSSTRYRLHTSCIVYTTTT